MSLRVKGISYVVGDVSAADIRRDLGVIRDDLRCTTVMLIDTDTEQLMEAARLPHADDPRHDLDMAGFGVVKTSADDPARWEPKEAFHEVARRYTLH